MSGSAATGSTSNQGTLRPTPVSHLPWRGDARSALIAIGLCASGRARAWVKSIAFEEREIRLNNCLNGRIEEMPMPLKTIFLNPPSFKNFDGGASSRWPATREIESYWYPVWLTYL